MALYGHYPARAIYDSAELKPLMTYKTFVANISEIPAFSPVSYGRTWISEKKTRIAVLPVGFTDGIDRELSSKGRVIINDKFYPMVGIIGIDRTMIDVGYDPIKTGDEAIIWGNSGKKEIPLSELSDITGRSLYVLICGIPERVKREYISD